MQTKHKKTEAIPGFDAVGESCKWKEAVAEATANMSSSERVSYLRRRSSVAAIRAQAAPKHVKV